MTDLIGADPGDRIPLFGDSQILFLFLFVVTFYFLILDF